MLVISRKSGERVRIGEEVAISILEISGSRVVLGIDAPREIPVRRIDQRLSSDAEESPGEPGPDGDGRAGQGLIQPLVVDAADGSVAPFEYPARSVEGSPDSTRRTPVVRVRRSRKIIPPTDPDLG